MSISFLGVVQYFCLFLFLFIFHICMTAWKRCMLENSTQDTIRIHGYLFMDCIFFGHFLAFGFSAFAFVRILEYLLFPFIYFFYTPPFLIFLLPTYGCHYRNFLYFNLSRYQEDLDRALYFFFLWVMDSYPRLVTFFFCFKFSMKSKIYFKDFRVWMSCRVECWMWEGKYGERVDEDGECDD